MVSTDVDMVSLLLRFKKRMNYGCTTFESNGRNRAIARLISSRGLRGITPESRLRSTRLPRCFSPNVLNFLVPPPLNHLEQIVERFSKGLHALARKFIGDVLEVDSEFRKIDKDL